MIYNLQEKIKELQSENERLKELVIPTARNLTTLQLRQQNEELKKRISYYNVEDGKQSVEIERLTIMNKLLAGHKKALEKELKRLR